MPTSTGSAERVGMVATKGETPALAVSAPVATRPPSARLVLTAVQGPSPCGPARVRKGDRVVAGQVVFGPEPGEGDTGAVPLHSPVCGKVVDVQPWPGPDGTPVPAVTVEPDGLGEAAEPLHRPWDPMRPDAWPPEGLLDFLRRAGVDGSPCPGQPPLYQRLGRGPHGGVVVINAVGCEPGLPSDMMEAAASPEATLVGAAALGRAAGAARVLVAVHRGGAADSALSQALAGLDGSGRSPLPVELVRLPDVDWIWVPALLAQEAVARARGARKEPARQEVPVWVESAATAAAAGRALMEGRPVTERLVTVAESGRLRAVRVPIGTPVASLLEAGSGPAAPDAPLLVLSGGPLHGQALPDLQVPVTKATAALTVMRQALRFRPQAACIRCGRCVEVCPAGLMPLYVARAAAAGRMDEARELGAARCLECAACTVVCPSFRPLLQWIRLAKYGRARRAAAGGVG